MAAGLPTELWDQILKDLPLTDVNFMTRVSKAINRVACPFLYRDLELKTSPSSPLLRTLLANPKHAESVRRLSVEFTISVSSDKLSRIASVIHQMRSLQYIYLYKTGQLRVGKFLKEIGITNFPQLENFVLDLEDLRFVHQPRYKYLATLPQIYEFTVRPSESLLFLSSDDYPNFQLPDFPQAKVVKIYNTTLGKAFRDEREPLVPWSKTSVTKELYLNCCLISSSDLKVLLNHHNKLSNFFYKRKVELEDFDKWFDFPQITEGLLRSQETLQHLELSMTAADYDGIIQSTTGHSNFIHGLRSTVGFLKGFTQLRTLHIELAVLLGWDVEEAPPLSQVLPPSLRYFRLNNAMGWWEGYQWDNFFANESRVGPWLHEYMQNAPCLTLVQIEYSNEDEDIEIDTKYIPEGVVVDFIDMDDYI